MANLKERIERLEQALDGEEPGQVIVVVLCHEPADVGLSDAFAEWFTHDEVIAGASGPPWARTAIADCERERQARIRAAEGQGN